MNTFNFWVSFDASKLRRFQSLLQVTRSNRLGRVMAEVGEIYRQYLRNRYISLSAGSGHWPDIEESTKRRKKKIAKNPNWIMRETDTVLNAIDVDYTNDGIVVGFVHDKSFPKPRSSLSVYQVAEIHQTGRNYYGKVWDIIVPPSEQTITRVNQLLRNTTDDIVAGTK